LIPFRDANFGEGDPSAFGASYRFWRDVFRDLQVIYLTNMAMASWQNWQRQAGKSGEWLRREAVLVVVVRSV
jgi:hypothetical protein